MSISDIFRTNVRKEHQLALILMLCLVIALPAWAGPGDAPGSASRLSSDFEQLVDRYLCDVRGVGCSLPADMSAASFARRIEVQQAVLADLENIDRGTLTLEQDIDWRFLRGILKANIRAESEVQRWRQDPRLYVFTNGIIFKIQSDHRHPDERGRGLVADLQTLRARLQNAEENLTQYIPNWLVYANARIDGTVTVMQEHVPAFADRLESGLRDELRREADLTVVALGRFRDFVNEANRAVFDNGQHKRALNLDAREVPGDFELVYIDTHYISKSGVAVDYLDFYHFLEGLTMYDEWEQYIDHDSKHRRLQRQPSEWTDKKRIHAAFDRLFQRYQDSILVVSYRSDGIPSGDELVSLLKKYKARVRFEHFGQYRYVLSTNSEAQELLLVGT